MRFSIGRSRQLICMLSLWAISVAALPTTRNVIADEPMLTPQGSGQMGANQISAAHVVREGTEIPLTQGRIAMLGRRWAFVPDQTSLLHKQLNGEKLNDVLGVKRGSPSKLLRIVSKTEVIQKADRVLVPVGRTTYINRLIGPVTLVSTPNRGSSSNRLISSKSSVRPSEHQDKRSLQANQLILAENLMLERIVDSIRSDVSDDRWILSGTINEFFGENRMVVTTAQRGIAE